MYPACSGPISKCLHRSFLACTTLFLHRPCMYSLPETSSMPCGKYCAVCSSWHTANLTFAVCQKKEDTANNWHTANIFFAVCQEKKHTANTQHTAKVCICRVLLNKAHGKALAHGKEALFAVCLGYYTRQSFGTR